MNVSLQTGNLRMYSIEPPGSGLILGFILNILDEYGFTPESMEGDQKIITHQRITEAMKWAYARRTELGDANFVDVTEVIVVHVLLYIYFIYRLVLSHLMQKHDHHQNIIITINSFLLYTCKPRFME